MYTLLSLVLFLGSFVFMQTPSAKLPDILYKVYIDDQWVQQELEQRPGFGTGEQDIFKFIGKNARYPITAQRANISGTVLITAEVTEEGQLVNEKIEKELGAGLGKEALRVVQMMPDTWTPGKLNGEPVRVQVTIPVVFRTM
jgi:TonB family protein